MKHEDDEKRINRKAKENGVIVPIEALMLCPKAPLAFVGRATRGGVGVSVEILNTVK